MKEIIKEGRKPEAILMKELIVRQLIPWKHVLPYLAGEGKCGRLHIH